MTDKPDFVLVPDPDPNADGPNRQPAILLGRLRECLAAIAVFAVGGARLLQEKRGELPGAALLLQHLDGRG